MRVGICGWYGLGNAGDEAILSGILSGLRARDAELDIVVLSQNPAHTRQTHSVDAVWMLPWGVRWTARQLFEGRLPSSITAIRTIDAFVLGGGGLLSDWQRGALYTWLHPLWLAGMLGKKRAVLAVGAGPITTHAGCCATRRVLNRSHFVSVRDETSRAWLRKCGVAEPIEVIPDPAILVEPTESMEQSKTAASVPEISGDTPWVAICPAPIFQDQRFWPGQQKRHEQLKRDLAQMAEFVVRELDADVVLVSLHWDMDAPISRDIAAQVPSDVAARVHVLSRLAPPAELVNLLAGAQLTVSVRLHGLVLSAAAGTPPIGIAYHHKTVDFLESLGSTRFVPLGDGRQMPDADLDVARLCDMIQETWSTRDHQAVKTRSAVARLREECNAGLAALHAALREDQPI